MDSLLIRGGVPLHGEVTISGAKNAVLPLMAATLLTAERCVIRRAPDLSDVKFMAKILMSLGAKVEVDGDIITVEARKLKPVGNYNLIRKMRGSICILGPLLARQHQAKVSLPGGCVIGTRPIDLHLKGMRDLGAEVTIESGYIHAKAPQLVGADVFFWPCRPDSAGHGKRHDGRGSGPGRYDHRERGLRAGGGGPCVFPEQDGGADRRRGKSAHHDQRREIGRAHA